jgi:hypothetical protein
MAKMRLITRKRIAGAAPKPLLVTCRADSSRSTLNVSALGHGPRHLARGTPALAFRDPNVTQEAVNGGLPWHSSVTKNGL